jgi:ribosome biogenesis protein Nip4
MKPIQDFAAKVDAKVSLDAGLVVVKDGRYFLLNNNLQRLIRKDFYFAGSYLGKFKGGRFFPSFLLLAILTQGDANKIVVNKKAAWLFICGRDVFAKGIEAVHKSRRKGAYTLVLNEFGECLGFGRIVRGLDSETNKNEVAAKNISDIGDFLRREG